MEVRRADRDDLDDIIPLLARTLGWGTDERYVRYFRWKHLENPVGVSPMWIALEDGAIVGLRAWLRWRLRLGPRPIVAVRAVDTATDPAHQGKGIFRRLTLDSLSSLRDDGVDLVFNTPNAASGAGYLKMGWVPVGRLPVAVRFRGPRGVRTALARRGAAERWSLPCDVGIDARAATDDADLLLRHPDRLDEGRLRTAIDAAFLRWRYGLPELHYRTLVVGDALAFFRLRQRGAATECVVAHVLGADVRGRGRAVAAVASAVRADRTLVLDDSVGLLRGFVRAPGVGPLLMRRPLTTDEAFPRSRWDLSLGDVELF